ncbi:hypothetical protein LCGC14_0617610 [marine sediment metagenome]|uniref:Uncharacterized protein n=1 Tax=marine sediment metagenome TaxID=412755 RepID=A0A0F9RAM6_9ZZZZ
MGDTESILSYIYEQLLYPLNYSENTKIKRKTYFKYKRRMLKYRIIKTFLIIFIIFLTDKVFKLTENIYIL